MHSRKKPRTLLKLTNLALAATLCCAGILVQAAPSRPDGPRPDEVSPDLRAEMGTRAGSASASTATTRRT